MICISIAQVSRRLALADMVNAAGQCDVIELCLDRFAKAPEMSELIGNKPKPVIMSCRRTRDGGNWKGSEEERLALLRQCIISKSDFVEIELDVADQIRKFPPTKRIISYTNLAETPRDIARIYGEAQKKSPDVIKLVTLARTPEEAWPLVQILAKPAVPTVVVGLGKPGVMLTVLGKKLGSPWTYAALERGMESYPGQPTVQDLRSVYHYGVIERGTRLVGVTGFGTQQFATVAALNAAFARLGLPARCLPLEVGGVGPFRKVIDLVRLAAVVVDDEHCRTILEVASELEPAARRAQAADLIVRKGDKWLGYNTVSRAVLAVLEQAGSRAERPLAGRVAMVVGSNATARAVAYGIKERGGVPIIASRDPNDGQFAAQLMECRHILLEGLYSTMHDVLVVCSEEKEKLRTAARSGEATLHSGYLKPSMTVMDLTRLPHKSPLLADAELLGCTVVSPRQVLLELLERQVGLITGQQVPRERLEETLTEVVGEET